VALMPSSWAARDTESVIANEGDGVGVLAFVSALLSKIRADAHAGEGGDSLFEILGVRPVAALQDFPGFRMIEETCISVRNSSLLLFFGHNALHGALYAF
jgi:hypothetical protein